MKKNIISSFLVLGLGWFAGNINNEDHFDKSDSASAVNNEVKAVLA